MMTSIPKLKSEISVEPTDPKIEVHEPRVFAQNICVAACSKLRDKLGEASTSAIRNRNKQFDVVCGKKALLGCSAEVVETGEFLASDDTERFYPNMDPFEKQTYFGPIYDPAEKVQNAIHQCIPRQDIDLI